jgi:1,4-alpha-glucan branching enzyme
VTKALKKHSADHSRPRQAAIDAIVSGRHGDPFATLGPHRFDQEISVRVVAPSAEAVDVVDSKSGGVLGSLERLHEAGFFAGSIEAKDASVPYRLRFRRGEARRWAGPCRAG